MGDRSAGPAALPALTRSREYALPMHSTHARAIPVRAALLLAVLAPLSGCAGPKSSATRDVDPAVRAALLSVREEVWRAWFGNDRAQLLELLPEDFVSLDFEGGPSVGREPQLAGAAEFQRAGGRLVALEFPETEIQQLGDVAVLYTTFRLELETAEGAQVMTGRATEVFERRDGRWVHPGWHVDTTPPGE